MIAALYVATNGCYFNLPGVDPWDEKRDARTYPGPHRVIAHPPCARWGRYWYGSPSGAKRYTKGDDNGCFEAALSSVRTWGGVLEHPEGSLAWAQFGLAAPPRTGAWIMADFCGGWTCCLEQGRFGHRARKPTWLYLNGIKPPSLDWSASTMTLDRQARVIRDRGERSDNDAIERMSRRERTATPIPFRDLLIGMVS